MSTTWRIQDREYTLTDETFTKREMAMSQFPDDERMAERTAKYLLSRGRLENEYHTLRFLRENTTLPVPRVIERKYGEDGSMSLTMERIQGVTIDDIAEENRKEAHKSALAQFKDMKVLQQLRGLHRDHIGSVSGAVPVIVPFIAISLTDRAYWPPIHDKEASFVFCHNDLGPHNILVDPETYEIKAIIDWEYAGFFPPWFERALWNRLWQELMAMPWVLEQQNEFYVARIEEFFAPHVENSWSPKEFRPSRMRAAFRSTEDGRDRVEAKESIDAQKRETYGVGGLLQSLQRTMLELSNWIF